MDISRFVFADNVGQNPLLCHVLLGLKVFGYMIFNCQTFPRINCFRGMIFTVFFIVFNITQYIDLISIAGNIDLMTSNAATTFLFTTTVYRMLNFYWNRTKYVNLVKEVHSDISEILSNGKSGEIKIIHEIVDYNKRLTKIFWIGALITGNLMCLNTFIQSFFYDATVSNSLPPTILRSWFPFDDLWGNFSIVYLTQLTAMWIGMIIVPCYHSFIVCIMLYGIAVLKIINYKLENIHDYAIDYKKDSISKDQTIEECECELFVECIKKHNAIVEFIKRLNDLINSSLFMDFIIFSVLLCALLFSGSRAGISVKLAINICYIATMVGILWMYYWHANEINYYSTQLAVSAYNNKWYSSSKKFKKILNIFIIRSQRPMVIKAGFLSMKLETFIAILRASYSYFTLLTQVSE